MLQHEVRWEDDAWSVASRTGGDGRQTYQMSLLTRAEGGCNPAGNDFFVILEKGVKSYLAGARGGENRKKFVSILNDP